MKKVKIMGPDGKRRTYQLASDVDLNQEPVPLPNGAHMTDADVTRIVEAVHVGLAGRPSLTAPGTHSPEVKARVPRSTKEQLDALAARRGTTASVIIREALDAYLRSA